MRRCRIDGQFQAMISCDARGCGRAVYGFGKTRADARTDAESAAYEYRWLKLENKDYCEAHAYTRRQRPKRTREQP